MSIFKKIIASFLAVSIIPITIFGIFIVNQVFDITQKTAFESNTLLSSQISSQIDTYFDTIQKTLESLASLPEIKNFDKERVDKILDSYHTSYTIYYGHETVFEADPFESFMILDNKGMVKTIYPLEEKYLGINYSYQPFFEEVIWTKQTYISPDIIISDFSQKPIVKIAVPVIEESNNVSSIIVANIKLESITQLTNQIKIGKTGYIFTINKKGAIITHPDEKLILERKNIQDLYPGLSVDFFEKNLFEESILYPQKKPNTVMSYSFPEKIEWTVIVNQSLDEVMAVPLNIRNQFILIFFLVTIFSGIIAFYLSQGITIPLKKLSKKVIDIGKKQNMETEINIKTGDEIEELATSFNQMTKKLKLKTTDLERKTKELQERLKELNKWYGLTVGREIRMVELKKQIKDLKEKLNKSKKPL